MNYKNNFQNLKRVDATGSFLMGRTTLFIFLFLFLSVGMASPSLMLFPTRVVFEKNKRAIQVDLTNTGTSPGTYRITLENKRMTEGGQFITVDSPIPGELSADKLIQFSPRQIVLAPGAGQTIRIVLRKPAELPIGEYRSHLVFRRLPDATTNGDSNTVAKNEMGITLTPLIGASIPIVIQNGATEATVKLSEIKYIKSKAKEAAAVEFRIGREGNRSAYGDLTVFHSPKNGAEKEVAVVKGIAIYSPYPSRKAKVELPIDGSVVLTTGKLTVRYTEPKSAGGELISENSIDLP